MSGSIDAWHQGKSGFRSGVQGCIKLLLRKFYANGEAFRRIEIFVRIRFQRLIPQVQDAASLTVLKVRQSIINTGIKDGDQAAFSCKLF